MTQRITDLTLSGSSGYTYTFLVYPLGTAFKSLPGVYVVTRRHPKLFDPGFEHSILYFGETEDLSTRFDNHHKAASFRRNNANCIGVLLEGCIDEVARRAIESDLVMHWNPCCNG